MLGHLIDFLTNPFILVFLLFTLGYEYILTSNTLTYLKNKSKNFSDWFINQYENNIYKDKEIPIKTKKIDIKINNIFAKFLSILISIFVVFVLEILWELGFKNINEKFKRSETSKKFLHFLNKLSPKTTLFLFLAPFFLMELMGAFSVVTIINGYLFLGVLIYIIKLLIYIPVFFILHTQTDKMNKISWFKRRYISVSAIITWFKGTQSYIKVVNKFKKLYLYIEIFNIYIKKITILIIRIIDDNTYFNKLTQRYFQKLKIKKDNNEDISKEEYEKLFQMIEEDKKILFNQ